MTQPESKPDPQARLDARVQTSLTAALEERAATVDVWTTDLIAAATDRQQTRRRRRTIAAGIAGVVVAVGVPVALSLPDDAAEPGGSTPGPTRNIYADDENTSWIPDGWRPETWRGIELAVPSDWGYGSVVDGCFGGRGDTPVVDRAGSEPAPDACPNGVGLGLRFAEKGRGTDSGDSGVVRAFLVYPAGATVDRRRFGDLEVSVVTDSSELNRRILATIHDAGNRDVNGCPTRVTVPADGERVAEASSEQVRISVCTYQVGLAGPGLELSERLSVIDSAKARASLEKAPAAGGAACVTAPGERVVAWFTAEGEALAWLHLADCNRVDVAGGSRQLTSEVAYWGVSPARTDIEGARAQ